ncbi:MAG: LptF/LptG family permease, partial [Bacteroidales bacterium]
VPYRRETFSRKEILIPFDASFNRMDDNVMEDKYIGKDISQLKNSIDSMSVVVDSLGQRIGKELKTNGYYWITERTGIFGQQTTKTSLKNFDLDREYAAAPVQQRENLLNRALARARAVKQEYEFKSYNAEDQKYIIRRHEIEMHKKFTLSFACLIFFFIGA